MDDDIVKDGVIDDVINLDSVFDLVVDAVDDISEIELDFEGDGETFGVKYNIIAPSPPLPALFQLDITL